MEKFGFLKVAAAIPHVKVADCGYNARQITAVIRDAADRDVEILVFPELSLTSYTCGDLFLQPTLINQAEAELGNILRLTASLPIVCIVGLPVTFCDAMYNCAVVFSQGRIHGIVPKRYIPNYAEFYEARWFSSGRGITDTKTELCGQIVSFGEDVMFSLDGVMFGTEICEDFWVPIPPSSMLALSGASIIFNLSASPESVGKNKYLRTLIAQQSARTMSAYIYCSSGFGESSSDLVFAGNGIIAENGMLLGISKRFCLDEQLIIADIDTESIETSRRRTTTFRRDKDHRYTVVGIAIEGRKESKRFDRTIEPMPFVPSDQKELDDRCDEILKIQAAGLARRLVHTGCKTAVIGISGGLDSTLALLATVAAFDKLGIDRKGITGITMPGFGTTDRTYHNAVTLMNELGVSAREISIKKACEQHFEDIGLPSDDRSAAYENSQARERTQILMDVANMVGGIVIGTGDLSESALGWATYNGDQMSMYGINCSIPKTLVRHLVKWLAETSDNQRIRTTLLDIVDTPVSPELLPLEADGATAQHTEDIVGPYELHDFFLYNFVRAGFSPEKILFLAEKAFAGKYDRATINKWLRVFVSRFFSQQFKRSAMPDGPKVGSVSLSPRGNWRMPSDASAEIWLNFGSDNSK